MPEISEIAEYTKIIQNVVVSACALSTAIIALIGYNKWKKELKGKSEYEKAKEVLKAVYKVKRGFSIVRNPMMFSYEYPEHIRDNPGHAEGNDRYEAIAHAYEKRWKHLNDAFQELEDLNLDAIVEWGSEFSEVIVPLRKCKGELLVCLQRHLQSLKNPERAVSKREEGDEERSVLYEIGSDSELDSFTPQIYESISGIEKKLRKHIEK